MAAAFSWTCSVISVFTMLMPISVRSRMMDSTSRPTYPTSVNFDASILRKGAWTSFASLRAISVFPTPVGPIMMMFFGMTSSRRSSDRRCRLQRFRSAMATARLALCWPMTYLSSSSTTCRGVSESFKKTSGLNCGLWSAECGLIRAKGETSRVIFAFYSAFRNPELLQ